MDRIDAMRVFIRIVERKSFVRAAGDLGLPASTATDAIRHLEQRLGTRLLERTTRQVRPTLDGEAYYRRCLDILAEIDEAESAFGGGVPRGLLRVNVLGAQARQIILPALAGFFDSYPEIELYLAEDDRFVDLVGEGIDCVVRAGQIGESDLVGRQIALLAEATVAAPGYVARHGLPQSPDALAGHVVVGFRSTASGGVLPLDFVVAGEVRTVALPARLMVSGAETLREAALRGFGIIQVPRYAVAADIAAGRLVDLMPDTPPVPMPIHVLYPRNRQMSLRVRVFIDWLVALYRQIGMA